MRDPYLYEDVPVLKNLLDIKDTAVLEQAEADITYLRLYDVDGAISHESFDLSRLLEIHKYIFGDIYEWAGKPRVVSLVKGERVLGGDTVRYSQPGEIEQSCATVFEKLNGTELSPSPCNLPRSTVSGWIKPCSTTVPPTFVMLW